MHKQADYLINIKLGKQNFDVIQIKRLFLRVIRKKTTTNKHTHTHTQKKRPGDYINLIRLPSFIQLLTLMSLTLVFIATRHYQNTDKRIDYVVYWSALIILSQ